MNHGGSTTSSITLGKRKRQETFFLQLSASSSSNLPPPTDFQDASNLLRKLETSLIISNGKLAHDTGRQFVCTIDGCEKSYKKKCKLEEHERSHSGEVSESISSLLQRLTFFFTQRPFTCTSCGKTYFRDSHLQAHSRTHMPSSDKPFFCGFVFSL